MADAEPARKKRGADNQLTQDNWQEEAEGDDDTEVPCFLSVLPPPPHSTSA